MSVTKAQVVALNRLREYIDSTPSQRENISNLVSISNLSEYKLTRGFKELFGVTIYNYQMKVCMNHAATLLKAGMTVKEVSYQLGYKTPNNFSRAFTKYYSFPPQNLKGEIWLH